MKKDGVGNEWKFLTNDLTNQIMKHINYSQHEDI